METTHSFCKGGILLSQRYFNKRKYIIFFVCILCVGLFALLYIYNNVTSTNTNSKVSVIKPPDTKPEEITTPNPDTKAITMKEAVEIASKDAKKWSKDAKLIKIISTDAIDKPSIRSGELGKRNTWNLKFADTKSNFEYEIFVSNGEVVVQNQIEFGKKKQINDSDFILDSSEALAIAKEHKKLKPGLDWAIGYHFNLEYASYSDKLGKDYLIIQVIGLSPKGNFAHVDIDEITGEIISSSEKTYDNKGNPIWTDF